MTTDTQRLTEILREVVEAALDLYAILPDAYEYQWRPGALHSDREGGPRGKGGPPADPTGETAVDPRRLRLRAAVIQSERELEDARDDLAAAAGRLRTALEAWRGGGRRRPDTTT